MPISGQKKIHYTLKEGGTTQKCNFKVGEKIKRLVL
jgi:hypothetical protein